MLDKVLGNETIEDFEIDFKKAIMLMENFWIRSRKVFWFYREHKLEANNAQLSFLI